MSSASRLGLGRDDVTEIVFSPAPPVDHARGHLGWVGFLIADTLRIEGVSVRRTRTGRITLSFPIRRDKSGRQHAVVRPTNDTARRAIESAVLAQIDLSGVLADADPR